MSLAISGGVSGTVTGAVAAQAGGQPAAPTADAAPAAADDAAVQRGAALAASRSQGLCVLCHALPGQPEPQQGTVGPPLHGVGGRLGAEQLRARLLQPERFNPDTVMPAYGRTQGLLRVPPALQGQPLLRPDQVDDLVAWMASLR